MKKRGRELTPEEKNEELLKMERNRYIKKALSTVDHSKPISYFTSDEFYMSTDSPSKKTH